MRGVIAWRTSDPTAKTKVAYEKSTLAIANAPKEPILLPLEIVVMMSKIAIGPSGSASPNPDQNPSEKMSIVEVSLKSLFNAF